MYSFEGVIFSPLFMFLIVLYLFVLIWRNTCWYLLWSFCFWGCALSHNRRPVPSRSIQRFVLVGGRDLSPVFVGGAKVQEKTQSLNGSYPLYLVGKKGCHSGWNEHWLHPSLCQSKPCLHIPLTEVHELHKESMCPVV